MKLTPLKKVIIILFLTLIAGYISLPPEFSLFGKTIKRPGLHLSIKNFKVDNDFNLVLGLDLAGGSHLAFEADTSGLSLEEKKDALKALRNVIERRVNLFGVSEPNVQIASFGEKDRIIVELPGVKDTKEAIDLIVKLPNLVLQSWLLMKKKSLGFLQQT